MISNTFIIKAVKTYFLYFYHNKIYIKSCLFHVLIPQQHPLFWNIFCLLSFWSICLQGPIGLLWKPPTVQTIKNDKWMCKQTSDSFSIKVDASARFLFLVAKDCAPKPNLIFIPSTLHLLLTLAFLSASFSFSGGL